MDKEFILELSKIIAPVIISYIALLRTRTDLDRFAASQRAKELGEPAETFLRKRWYHILKKEKNIKWSLKQLM